LTWPAVIDFTGLGAVKERIISVSKRPSVILKSTNSKEPESGAFSGFTAALQPDFEHASQIQLVRSEILDLKEKGRSHFPATSTTYHIDFKEKKE